MDIAIVCYDGADDLDVVGPYRVFAGAADAGADCSVSLRTTDDREQVTTSKGLTLGVDGPLAAADPDLVVVPGGGWTAGSDEGARRQAEGGLPGRLRALHESGVTLAAVCTGGMILASAGLLDGRPAVTHHDAMADLRATAAEAVDARVVDDGDVLTAGGVTSGIDLALHVLEREFGGGVAQSVADTLAYDRSDDVVRRG